MNILADEQLKVFDATISNEERINCEERFNRLYYHLRNKEEKSFLGQLSLDTRGRLHWLVLLIYTIKNHLGSFTYQLINDRRIKTNRPLIFAVTHVGKFDIEIISEAIKSHYYLLSGDYEHIQGTVDAMFLAVNGVFYFNERVMSDRRAVTNKMITHLRAGGNLMYFPEGTWNLTPNLPVLPCYWGIVEIAQKSNAIIIPIAAEQYGKHFKINIGRNFDMNKFGIGPDEKRKAIGELRDTLATLKFEIWQSEPCLERKKMEKDMWKQYVAARLSEWPYFNMEYINGLTFKPSNTVAAIDAFSHLDRIKPTVQSAFLFNKRFVRY